MAFDWIDKNLAKDGTVFIAVPYKDCHWSPNHVNFFTIDDNDVCKYKDGTTEPCFNISKFIAGRGYIGEIQIFDEEKHDKRHPHKSYGQLDMVIKLKRP